MNKIGVAIFALLCLLARPAAASDWWLEGAEDTPLSYKVVKKADHSGYRVNWVEKYLEVMAGATVDERTAVNMAHAVSMATKTARHLAYEKLAESVRGLHITADARYDRELMLDSNVRTDLEARIRGAKVIREETSEFPDGSVWVEVTLGMNILGPDGVAGIVDRGQQYHRRTPGPGYEPTASGVVPAPRSTGNTRNSPKQDLPNFKEKYTGLVVDALGLNGRPVLVPRIVTQSGHVLYDEQMVNRKYMERHALVDYAPSVEAASKLSRVGKKPLVIKAVGVSGDYPGDIIVSDDAAALIHATIKQKKIIDKCGVAIVL